MWQTIGLLVAALQLQLVACQACASLPGCSCNGTQCTMPSSVASNSSVTLASNSTLSVLGSMSMGSATQLTALLFSLPSVPLLSANDSILLFGGSLIVVVDPSLLSANVTLLSSAVSLRGAFASVQIVSSHSCFAVAATPPVYAPTTLSLSFQSLNICSSFLSAGASVGIALGAVAVAAALLLAAVLYMRRSALRRDAAENARIRGRRLDELKT